jgi:hypothetical protein
MRRIRCLGVLCALTLALAAPLVRAGDEGTDPDDIKDIKDIIVEEPPPNELYGILAAVDLTAGTLTVDGNVLAVDRGTVITLDNEEISLAKLAAALAADPELGVEIQFTELDGRLVATYVYALKQPAGGGVLPGILYEIFLADGGAMQGGGAPRGGPPVRGHGTLVSVGPGPVVRVRLDGAPRPVNMLVRRLTKLQVDGAPVTLPELRKAVPVGGTPEVDVRYNPRTSVVHSLNADRVTADETATIMGIDPVRRVLSVRLEPTVAAAANRRRVGIQLLTGSVIIRDSSLVRIGDLRRDDTIVVSGFTSRGIRVAPKVRALPR